MSYPNRSRRRRLARAALGVGTAAGLAATTLVTMQPATAAVPTFPNNVVVFPDRDFVSVEGYADHAGETATLEVTRPGVGVMGSAKAVVSGTDVTPDIKAGDVVSIRFPDGSHDETITSSATVTQDMTLSGTTLTVTGSIGPDVVRSQMEQRIINP